MSTTSWQSSVFCNEKRLRGFTLIELLVVIAVIAILAAILLPTLARSKARAQAIFCMNDTRQLTLAWVMYSDDHDGRLTYNLAAAAPSPAWSGGTSNYVPMRLNWANNVLDWDTSRDNTNVAKLVATGLGPYTAQTAKIYRCPSDDVLHPIQQAAGWQNRVRSYSMNAMMGDAGPFSRFGYNLNNPDYIQFFKFSAIQSPSDLFVFVEEHPDTIGDGYFVSREEKNEWVRLPASYHDRAAIFSFADGHAEIHHWRYARTCPPSKPLASKYPIQIPANEMDDFNWVVSHMSVDQVPY
jgi:prepilin-type N-terminal cleavage/methylation domain-containing protein/prepilin-type processing-associated H-X9-DG protein